MEKEIIIIQPHEIENPVVYVQDNTKFYRKYFELKEDVKKEKEESIMGNDSIINDVFEEIDKDKPLAAYEKFVYTYKCNHCLCVFFREKPLDICPSCGSYDLTEKIENEEIVFNRLAKRSKRHLR